MGRPATQASADGIGIDFGTTNSVVAVSTRSKPTPRIKALLADDIRPHPSVVWYQVSEEPRGRTHCEEQHLGVFRSTRQSFHFINQEVVG